MSAQVEVVARGGEAASGVQGDSTKGAVGGDGFWVGVASATAPREE